MAEAGYYYSFNSAFINPETGEEFDDLMSRLLDDAEEAGYNVQGEIWKDTSILYTNEYSMFFSDTSFSPFIFAVGGIDKIEYIVPKLVIGELPPSKITVKSTPTDVLKTTEAEVIWYKSTDGELFEEMTENEKLEENAVYKYELVDELSLYNDTYKYDSGIFVDSYSKSYVNGEEKAVNEATFSAISVSNPSTGTTTAYISLILLVLVFSSMLYSMKNKLVNRSNK